MKRLRACRIMIPAMKPTPGRHARPRRRLSPPAQQRSPQRSDPQPAAFSVVEATIPDMQQAMREGRVTSRQMVEQYLQRIALYEDKLNAVMTVNPKALEEADRLDQEHKRRQGPRPAARHPDRAQGQHPHHRHADHRRRDRVRRV